MIIYKVHVSLNADGWHHYIQQTEAIPNEEGFIVKKTLWDERIKTDDIGLCRPSMAEITGFRYYMWCLEPPEQAIPSLKIVIADCVNRYKESIDNLFKYITNDTP